EADVLLCDEPTGALDKVSGNQVMSLFEELNREDGITLVVVTHESYISRMGERIISLEDGRIATDEKVSDRLRASDDGETR
ncbi:MAG: ABC transporter ATP-binding protein, partial [Myxococcales bacterium]|nr:ABC transporter ATP-binding protein [Myxococcales bacterium]